MDKWVELKENNQYEININGKVRNKITKKELNYSVGSICDACKKNIKTYKNSIWEYVEEE